MHWALGIHQDLILMHLLIFSSCHLLILFCRDFEMQSSLRATSNFSYHSSSWADLPVSLALVLSCLKPACFLPQIEQTCIYYTYIWMTGTYHKRPAAGNLFDASGSKQPVQLSIHKSAWWFFHPSHFLLDAIEWVSQSVSQWLIVSYLEIAIASPTFASLLCIVLFR